MPPIAKKDDRIVGMDMHIELVPSPSGKVPMPLPHPFSGPITKDLASSVSADDKRIALVGSGADNSPAHTPQAGDFMSSPEDKATVAAGSGTVFADGRPVARNGDPADSCNDLGMTRGSHVVSSGTVQAG